jgi:lipoate-protein ligase A
MSSMTSLWNRHHWRGTAGDFHALNPAGERALWWCDVSQPALIVGSSQSVDLIDRNCAMSREIEVVRRRSGGGLVFVHPSDSVWIDVTIPRDDPLWTDDVSSSMLWLGDVFVQALSPWVAASRFQERFSAGEYGRDVCFASHSPGEVFVGANKLVGISQRRTRDGARFQCVLYRKWTSDTWLSCVTSPHAVAGVQQLHIAALDVSAVDIVDAVFDALPL